MNLRDTWKNGDDGKPACVWCYRHADVCVIEDPCNGRKSFEETFTPHHGLGCGCYWCSPVRSGISPPPSTEEVRRMDSLT